MRIELIKFKEENVTQLVQWIHSKEELMQWAGPAYNFPFTEKQMLAELYNAEKGYNILIYSVLEKKENIIIGHCQVVIDKKNNSARFGKILIGNKTFRGKGLGQQIIKEFLKIGFVDLKLHRIDLGVFDFNTNAIKSYEKSGFKKEGLLRDYSHHKCNNIPIPNLNILIKTIMAYAKIPILLLKKSMLLVGNIFPVSYLMHIHATPALRRLVHWLN